MDVPISCGVEQCSPSTVCGEPSLESPSLLLHLLVGVLLFS